MTRAKKFHSLAFIRDLFESGRLEEETWLVKAIKDACDDKDVFLANRRLRQLQSHNPQALEVMVTLRLARHAFASSPECMSSDDSDGLCKRAQCAAKRRRRRFPFAHVRGSPDSDTSSDVPSHYHPKPPVTVEADDGYENSVSSLAS
eukprot:EC850359.1.p2 GENE.EC850359.1~~EC850359.1.p2  ORF type:complete len:147 (+),score=11.59 EC850359.1:80-520(+)